MASTVARDSSPPPAGVGIIHAGRYQHHEACKLASSTWFDKLTMSGVSAPLVLSLSKDPHSIFVPMTYRDADGWDFYFRSNLPAVFPAKAGIQVCLWFKGRAWQ